MKPTCPKCGWTTTHRSTLNGIRDVILGWCLFIPFRCRSCGRRFFRFSTSAQQASSGSAVAGPTRLN